MQVDEVIRHYQTATAAARAVNLAGASTLTNWRRRYGGKVPELYARKYHERTRGKLKFDPRAYE